MIDKELEAQILRLYHAEKWKVGSIAEQLRVHHETVRRVLRDEGLPDRVMPRRKSMSDPYADFIRQTLEKWPTLCASRIYDMVRERGYPGKPDHFRTIVARYRRKPPAEAFLRLRTLPGEQAQVDWAHFGSLPVPGGQRPLIAFVMVLSWSRHLFVQFGFDMRCGAFLRAHQAAFSAFGGVPRILLYDNLKSAVLERRGDVIRFNDQLLSFAAHHRYEPRPVAPYRGNEKGRVERAIRHVRDNFFAARSFLDVDDLNAQAAHWCQVQRGERRSPEDRSRTILSMFEEERALLLPLPADRFPAADRVEASVGKTPYVRFDQNDYSVPHDRVRRTVSVVADHASVRIIDGLDVVAEHPRSWAKGAQIEDPCHLEALVARKREARQGRGMDRLATSCPATQRFLAAVAERGGNLGAHTIGLLKLLDAHGPEALEIAVTEVLRRDAPNLPAIHQVLDQRRNASGRPPPIAVPLPTDPRIARLVVVPHALSSYDRLTPEVKK